MTTPLDKVKIEYDKLVAKYKDVAADGKLSLSDVWAIFFAGLSGIVNILYDYTNLPFEERKKIGVDLMTQFYTDIIAPIDLSFVPNIIEPTFDRLVGVAVPSLIEATYDLIDELVYKKLA